LGGEKIHRHSARIGFYEGEKPFHSVEDGQKRLKLAERGRMLILPRGKPISLQDSLKKEEMRKTQCVKGGGG